jgi:uncharacterized protein YlxP (DUF503 family)
VFIGTLSVDVLLHASSLKEKRSVVRPVLAELVKKFAVSAAEVGHQDLLGRALLGVGVVAGEAAHVRDVLNACERLVAGRPELELLSSRQRLFSEEDE